MVVLLEFKALSSFAVHGVLALQTPYIEKTHFCICKSIMVIPRFTAILPWPLAVGQP